MNSLETRYVSEKDDLTSLYKEKLINQAMFQVIRNNDELLSSKKNLSNLNEKKGFHARQYSPSLEFKVKPNGAFYWSHPLYIIWNNVHVPSNGGYIDNEYFQEVMKKVKTTYPILSIPKKNHKHIKTESVAFVDINQIRCKGHKRGKSLDPKYLNLNKISSQFRNKINKESEKSFEYRNKKNLKDEQLQNRNKVNLENERFSQIEKDVNIEDERPQNHNKINLENEKSHQGRNKIIIEDIKPPQSQSKVNLDEEKSSQSPNLASVKDKKSSQTENTEEKKSKKSSKINENIEVENQKIKQLKSTEETDNQKIKKPIYEKHVKKDNWKKKIEEEKVEEERELDPDIKTDHWLHNNSIKNNIKLNQIDMLNYKNLKKNKDKQLNGVEESKQNMETNFAGLKKNMVVQKLYNENPTNTSVEISNFKITPDSESFTSTILSTTSSVETTDKRRRFEMNPLFRSDTSEKNLKTEPSLHYFDRDSTIFPSETTQENLRDYNEPSINPEVLLVYYDSKDSDDSKDSSDSNKSPENVDEPWNLPKSDGSDQDIDELVSFTQLSNDFKMSDKSIKNLEDQIFESNDFYKTENKIKESEATNIFSNTENIFIEEIELEYGITDNFLKENRHFEGFEYGYKDLKGFDNNNYIRFEDFTNYNLAKPSNQDCGDKIDKVTIFLSDYSDENLSNDTLTYKMGS